MLTSALLNYVGAVYIRNGIMGLDHMLQVYTLVLFSVTFAAGMLGFSESGASIDPFPLLPSRLSKPKPNPSAAPDQGKSCRG